MVTEPQKKYLCQAVRIRGGNQEDEQGFPGVGHFGMADAIVDNSRHHGHDLRQSDRNYSREQERTPVAEYQIPGDRLVQ